MKFKLGSIVYWVEEEVIEWGERTGKIILRSSEVSKIEITNDGTWCYLGKSKNSFNIKALSSTPEKAIAKYRKCNKLIYQKAIRIAKWKYNDVNDQLNHMAKGEKNHANE